MLKIKNLSFNFFKKKSSKEGEHSHDSIIFDYEFADIVVEVWPISMYVLLM